MSQIYEYRLRWEQNMGGGRGSPMEVVTNDWETGQHVWRKCCKNRLTNEVRDVLVTCNGKAFDPAGPWPRPPMIMQEPLPTAEYLDAMTPLTGAPVSIGRRT